MKVCPECQAKNEETSNFCKKCGFHMVDSAFKDKRERVLDEKKRFPRILLALIIIALLLGGVTFWIMGRKTTANPKIASQQKVVERVDYSGQTIPMTISEQRLRMGRSLSTRCGERENGSL
jgi:uncharacterized membrane protein YvbJ